MNDALVLHDISLTLVPGLVAYPKDVPFQRRLQRDLERGDASTVSILETSAHAGTHVDAPCHFFPGRPGVDRIPLDHLFGPCFVADCRHVPAVTAQTLARQLPSETQRLLLKTDNSPRLAHDPHAPFDPHFVYLDASGAQFCADHGLLLVGIDYLSIDQPGDPRKPAHHLLLGRGITILEGIILDQVPPGRYFLACAPLKIADADGAPARAVLIENL